MNNREDLIRKILLAKSSMELFPDPAQRRQMYLSYMKLIHPDHCSHPLANEAAACLGRLKDEIDNGKKHNDDCGEVTYFDDRCIIKGDPDVLQVSYDNYVRLMNLAIGDYKHFRGYMPKNMTLKGNELTVYFNKRSLPLSQLPALPEHHVLWILSRMTEFSAWLATINYCHAGISPDSVYVTPETHGVVFISFYHLTPVQDKLKSVSGRYRIFYPEMLFEKTRRNMDQGFNINTTIDIELAKRTAMFIAGDHSGNGNKFRKEFNSNFMNFILRFDTDHPFNVYKDYRRIIDNNYKKQFYPLNL